MSPYLPICSRLLLELLPYYGAYNSLIISLNSDALLMLATLCVL